MTLNLFPDVTKMLVNLLRGSIEMAALMDVTNIRGQLPDDPEFPAIRITRISDEVVRQVPFYLEIANVQIDCWGGNDRQAERIAQTVRAYLAVHAPTYTTDEGTVAAVDFLGMSALPDEEMTPPRRRYVVLVDLTVRPPS